MSSDSWHPLWIRQNILVKPPLDSALWIGYAQVPTPLILGDRLWRLYCGGRDGQNHSRIFAVDIDPGDDMRVLEVHGRPLLDLGGSGAFDSAGIAPAHALKIKDQIWLYYIGISLRRDVPYQLAIGLAVSNDGLTFERATAGPVLSVGPRDPYFVTAPFVRRNSAGFEIWYSSSSGWLAEESGLEPAYKLCRRISADGIVWNPDTRAVPLFNDPAFDEMAGVSLSRPWITEGGITEGGITEGDGGACLWFSRRGRAFRGASAEAYRLWHVPLGALGAEADRAARPVRFLNPPAPGDWDDQMQAYGAVVPYRGDLILFYNGNDFGRFGLGWARLPGGTGASRPVG